MTEKRGRGRPRPLGTIERDEQVYAALGNGPAGRAELALHFGVNVNIIYMSLIRLRKAGRVDKVRDGKYHRWTQTYQG
jgi:predicted Rossmann fold nucleotide-binding protein DprA/Smf involved in DNA uptake